MSGWLPAPPVSRLLVAVCAAYLLLTLPLAWQLICFPPSAPGARSGDTRIDKTHVGFLRYVHFLALAYVAWVAVGPHGARLRRGDPGWAGAVWSRVLAGILKVGQQSLAVFVFSMWLALILGFLLDFTLARGIWPTLAVNILGICLITIVAYVVGWFRASPWRDRPKH